MSPALVTSVLIGVLTVVELEVVIVVAGVGAVLAGKKVKSVLNLSSFCHAHIIFTGSVSCHGMIMIDDIPNFLAV